MTAPTLREIARSENLATTTPFTMTVEVAADPRELLIVCVAADNSGASGAAPSWAVSDARSNTYTRQADALQDPGAASEGIAHFVFTAPVTTGLAVGDAITVTPGAGTAAKAVVVYAATDLDTSDPVAVLGNDITGAGTTPSGSVTPTASGQLVLVSLAIEGPGSDSYTEDSDTTEGDWQPLDRLVTESTTATSNALLVGQWKVVTGTSLQAWAATITSRDYAGNILAFAATSAIRAAVASALPALTQAIAGALDVTVDASPTLPSLTQSMHGVNPAGPRHVAIAETLPSLTQAVAVDAVVDAAIASTLPSLSQSASGANPASGVIQTVLPALTQSIVTGGGHVFHEVKGATSYTLIDPNISTVELVDDNRSFAELLSFGSDPDPGSVVTYA